MRFQTGLGIEIARSQTDADTTMAPSVGKDLVISSA
jgi:hypothetical protein